MAGEGPCTCLCVEAWRDPPPAPPFREWNKRVEVARGHPCYPGSGGPLHPLG